MKTFFYRYDHKTFMSIPLSFSCVLLLFFLNTSSHASDLDAIKQSVMFSLYMEMPISSSRTDNVSFRFGANLGLRAPGEIPDKHEEIFVNAISGNKQKQHINLFETKFAKKGNGTLRYLGREVSNIEMLSLSARNQTLVQIGFAAGFVAILANGSDSKSGGLKDLKLNLSGICQPADQPAFVWFIVPPCGNKSD